MRFRYLTSSNVFHDKPNLILLFVYFREKFSIYLKVVVNFIYSLKLVMTQQPVERSSNVQPIVCVETCLYLVCM